MDPVIIAAENSALLSVLSVFHLFIDAEYFLYVKAVYSVTICLLLGRGAFLSGLLYILLYNIYELNSSFTYMDWMNLRTWW